MQVSEYACSRGWSLAQSDDIILHFEDIDTKVGSTIGMQQLLATS